MLELKIGSKGELFLPKSLRNELNIHPGDKIYLEINNNVITLRKVPNLLELLHLPSIGKPQTPDEIEKDLEEEQKTQMNYSKDDLLG